MNTTSTIMPAPRSADDLVLECSKCEEEKPLSEFWVVSSKGKLGPDGQLYSHCRECVRARVRGTQAKKRAWLTKHKLDHGCADCGYSEHPAALDFDHLPEHEKMFGVKDGIASVSWERLRAEVEKCEVVCANCHRVRTHERRQQEEVA